MSPLIEPPGDETAPNTRRRAVQVEPRKQLAALLDRSASSRLS
jgi:hypothetical protein